jgi:hypothetical protein
MSEQQTIDNLLTTPFDEKLIRMYLAEDSLVAEIIGDELLDEIVKL